MNAKNNYRMIPIAENESITPFQLELLSTIVTLQTSMLAVTIEDIYKDGFYKLVYNPEKLTPQLRVLKKYGLIVAAGDGYRATQDGIDAVDLPGSIFSTGPKSRRIVGVCNKCSRVTEVVKWKKKHWCGVCLTNDERTPQLEDYVYNNTDELEYRVAR